MSEFSVLIKRIRAIEVHPNADAIEFAVIDGYRSIVKKGSFKEGDLAAYIPEFALLPVWLLKRLNFWDAENNRGTLNGSEGNRVKAIKLRGALSQGICYPVTKIKIDDKEGIASDGFVLDVDHSTNGVDDFLVHEGDDAADMLGIKKYEPIIPLSMSGEVFYAGQNLTLKFDVENYKSHPEIFQDGEQVVFTEKLHGTCTVIAVLPYKDTHPDAFGQRKNILIFSKGLGRSGMVFKNNENNRENLYVRSTRDILLNIEELQRDDEIGVSKPIFILGETYGPGVQDLAYGKALGFRVFAASSGYRENQTYENWAVVEGALKAAFGFETVPVLYRGPFSAEVMREHTDGRTVMDGAHIREGIVMVPIQERYSLSIGRVCLKSVSANYLTRKEGTEFS